MTPTPADDGDKYSHLLVVDDDPLIRDGLADLLRSSGYSVATAEHGEIALDYLRKNALPRVIILDLMMPVMDGWEFRRRQSQDPTLAGIPTIVLSAALHDRRTLELQADEYFPKPLHVRGLLEAVERFTASAHSGPKDLPS
ncbi:MAG: response regulator [Actinomycetota bacterium]